MVLASHEVRFSLPSVEVAAKVWGKPEGLPVIGLHGWLDNAATFDRIAPLLNDVYLVALDLPGHGLSDHLPAGGYSLWQQAATVLHVAESMGWDRFALLGHSMGAGIASLVAAGCPERVERLVAIEALGALPEAADQTARRLREAVSATRALRGKQLRVFADPAPAVRARMAANALGEQSARLLVERGLKAVDGGFSWSSDPRLTLPTMVRMTPAQVDDLVAGIACRTRVIYADPPQPYLPEPERSRRAGLLPRGELVVIPGGHHLHMEQPADVAAAIGDFLGP